MIVASPLLYSASSEPVANDDKTSIVDTGCGIDDDEDVADNFVTEFSSLFVFVVVTDVVIIDDDESDDDDDDDLLSFVEIVVGAGDRGAAADAIHPKFPRADLASTERV